MDSYIRNHQVVGDPGSTLASDWQQGTITRSVIPRVLVVDDEEIVRLVLTEMLERLGICVKTATDGLSALEILQTEADTTDVVVFDMSMPEMQGDELFYAIRRMNPQIKLVLSSGMLDDMTIEEMSGHGLDGYLPKPYNIEQIARVLEEVLRTP